jgi:hypothetical protein
LRAAQGYGPKWRTRPSLVAGTPREGRPLRLGLESGAGRAPVPGTQGNWAHSSRRGWIRALSVLEARLGDGHYHLCRWPVLLPVNVEIFPVIANIFPVNLCREFSKSPLQHSHLLHRNSVWNPEIPDFPCKIPCLQGICVETGAIGTASPARHSAFQRISFFG